MLDVRRLRVLREVAARGSFSAAADALHFTQSAVSQQIAALEREAGMPLLERNPSVEVSLVMAEPPEGIEKLRSGEVDIALLIDTPWECAVDETIERVHLVDDPMYVCLPRAHPMARKTRLRLEDLLQEAWLLGTTGTCPDASIFLRACERAGFEPRIAFNSDDYLAIQGFVAAGMGVSFIPDLALVTVRDDVVIRELTPRAPERRIVAGVLAGGYRSPATVAMLETLTEVGQGFR